MIAVSFVNNMDIDGQTVVLSRDFISGTSPTTVGVNYYWWDFIYQPVVSAVTAATAATEVANHFPIKSIIVPTT